MKLSKIGETELIKIIKKNIKIFSKDVVKGIGDDAAVIKFNKKYYMLLTTDTLVEDIHFNLKFFTPEKIGSKAIESNISDIASMGGFPKYALISLIIPKKINIDFINKLYDGINKSARSYKINIVGGNLSDGKNISITTIMIGFVEKKYLSLRQNARINDLILVTGNLGASKAGLELLKREIFKKISGVHKDKLYEQSKKEGKSVNYYLNPKSKLGITTLLAKYGINAMEDISDGLASEIINICSESKTGAMIYKEKIPISKNTIYDAKKLKKDPYDFALYGGEDFELVFTINKNKLKKLNEIKDKIKFTAVGKILPEKEGIYLLDKNKKIKLKRGYEHF